MVYKHYLLFFKNIYFNYKQTVIPEVLANVCASCHASRPAAGIPYFTCARARKNLRSAARARLILQVIQNVALEFLWHGMRMMLTKFSIF